VIASSGGMVHCTGAWWSSAVSVSSGMLAAVNQPWHIAFSSSGSSALHCAGA